MSFRRILFLLWVLIAIAPRVVFASTITVEGNCTLVDAIVSANTDRAEGGCAAGDGDDVIDLMEDVILTEVNNDTVLNSGLPVIDTNITINGHGHIIQRVSSAPEFRIFTHKAGSLVLNDLTISGGYALSKDGQKGFGGGLASFIQFTSASLTINNCIFTDNKATDEGGGILLFSASRIQDGKEIISDLSFSINNSEISTNSSGTNGGGIMLFGKGIIGVINSSRIVRNQATVGGGIYGGGIYEDNNNPSLEIINSEINENTAEQGLGIFSEVNLSVSHSVISSNYSTKTQYNWIYTASAISAAGTFAMVNSQVTENEAVGISNSGSTSTNITNSIISNNGGVGIDNILSTVNVNTSIISGNNDGGFYIAKSTVDITNSTIAFNIKAEGDGAGLNIQNPDNGTPPTRVNILNSTIVGNRVPDGRWGYGIDNYGYTEINIINTVILNHDVRDCSHFDAAFVTGHNNLSNNSLCPGSTVIRGLDNTLRDNGGATMTIALLEGSNAIDAADPSVCPETDQRGATRIGTCDIGAYEFGGEIDSDSDGVLDGADVCPVIVNADQADTDQDGVGDACDQCLNTMGTSSGSGCPDGDTDTIPDTIDNCPSVANTDQADLNNDKTGNACQDSDKDSFTDDLDACPMVTGTAMGCPDKDEDEVPDESDVCPDAPGLAETNGCLFTGTVNGTKNLRSGPGTNFEIVDQIETDQSFAFLGRNDIGDWLRIRLDNGFEAWIATTLVITTTPLDEIPIIQNQ